MAGDTQSPLVAHGKRSTPQSTVDGIAHSADLPKVDVGKDRKGYETKNDNRIRDGDEHYSAARRRKRRNSLSPNLESEDSFQEVRKAVLLNSKGKNGISCHVLPVYECYIGSS
jgi:hypothetical protein